MLFVATISVPGYLPMDDEPQVFDTAQDAWCYLRDERARGEECDLSDDAEFTDTHYKLDQCSGNHGSARIAWSELLGSADGQGTIYGDTPGYEGDHDLGLAYSVSVYERPAVPDDFPVRPLKDGEPAKDPVWCDACDRRWDDAIPTTWTPVPAGRCPFEYYH
jgi:hypothetical protein